MVEQFRRPWLNNLNNKRILYVIVLITTVTASHGEAIIISFHAQLQERTTIIIPFNAY